MPPERSSARFQWLHAWGPALVAALVGAIPGTIALLNQRPETRVDLIQPTAVAGPYHGAADLILDGHAVNISDHDVVIEDGTCGVTFRETALATADLRVRSVATRHSRSIRNFVIRRGQGASLTCWISGRDAGVVKPSGYFSGKDTVNAAYVITTNDGRNWTWEGFVDVGIFDKEDFRREIPRYSRG
jgi:hypothetical protein